MIKSLAQVPNDKVLQEVGPSLPLMNLQNLTKLKKLVELKHVMKWIELEIISGRFIFLLFLHT
jgi:hypothetical protein